VREVVEGIERTLDAHGNRDGRAKGKVSSMEDAVREEMKAGLEGIQAKIEEIVKLDRNNAGSGVAFLSTGSTPGPAFVELRELKERVEVLGKIEEETQRLVGGLGDGAKERSRELVKEVYIHHTSHFKVVRLADRSTGMCR
jgi:heme oxygenase